MKEWIIALATLAIFFFLLAWVLAKRCIHLYEQLRKVEKANEDLKHSIRAMKTQIDHLHSKLYVNPDTEKMTALKMALHLKNEEIDNLREKVKKQNVLLKQKWEECKK